MGSKRGYRAAAAHLGWTHSSVVTIAKKHKWHRRALAYDSASNQLVPSDEINPQETLAFQHMVGTAMLDMGIKAIQLKNPGSIKTADAIKLVTAGAELQRKGAGVDRPDVQINFNGQSIDALNHILESLELEGSVVEETEDDSGEETGE
jgi:hypothetical protein